VVTFNTKELALALIADLVRELEPLEGSQIVVVDNASSDGSADAIAAQFPDITLHRLPANIGFGAAVNRGAADAPTRWLLLANPDARIHDGAVAELVAEASAHPGHGLYGGRFLEETGELNENSVAALPTPASLLGYATGLAPVLRRAGYRRPSDALARSAHPIDVVAVPGTFVLAETDAWRQIGGFDERFFLYSEDLDLCMRLAATGRHPRYVPAAVMTHIGGAASAGGSKGGGKEVMKLRSLVTLLRTHWSPGYARFGSGCLLVGVAWRRLTRVGRRTPSGRWETAWRERRSWLRGWPEPENGRGATAG